MGSSEENEIKRLVKKLLFYNALMKSQKLKTW